ncbi:MAG TPA: response regulator transcription factor [Opitutaceae bacterium]
MKPFSSKPTALVVDDEVQIRRLLRLTLEEAGYAVTVAQNGAEALREVTFRRPDIIVLDLGLPDMSGVDVLKTIRDWTQIPVLVLSVQNEQVTKISTLDLGADDFLTKPFDEKELMARIRALLRRNHGPETANKMKFGAIEIDLGSRTVQRNGTLVKLTAREYALLQLFIKYRGKVLTHKQILLELWGPRSDDRTHYLHVYMARLRQKLEEQPDQPRHFTTETGVGYRFVDN